MNLIITGTPGTGKTTLAKKIGEKFQMKVLNEKDFALQHKIGKFNEENELEIPIKEFQKKVNAFFKTHDNIILEGHVLCESKLLADYVLLITITPEELEARLESRNYPPEKIMDNVFCEGIQYCKKHVKRNYPKNKVIEIASQTKKELTLIQAITALESKFSKSRQKNHD